MTNLETIVIERVILLTAVRVKMDAALLVAKTLDQRYATKTILEILDGEINFLRSLIND